MSLQLNWVGEDAWERVTKTRALCYAAASNELDRYRDRLHADPRNRGADILLAEQDGVPVGTATAMHLTMWVRGAPIACQGVAYVGTIKTHRRGAIGGSPGVATQVMRSTLDKARERGQVVSALMPFRASFYEHFGYGLVERQNIWTVPLAVLPTGRFDTIRFYEERDFDALVECRNRIARRGQGDIERTAALWELYLARAEDGLFVVDRPAEGAGDGQVRGWLYFQQVAENGKTLLRVEETGYEDAAGLMRLLHFLASLKDQYSAAVLTLPADLPLNRLLRETQLPHRAVEHATASVRPQTRMQVRVLDYKRLIEGMHLPPAVRGKVSVAVRESEGNVSRFAIDLSDGRGHVTPASGEALFECNDVTWAAVVCGDLKASAAVELGLATCRDRSAAESLGAFAMGPAPYCMEYF